MEAQNLEVLVEIVSTKTRTGTSRKSGNAYSMEICQCIVRGEDVLVGELILPKDHPVPVPGLYRAEFEVAVGFDKSVHGQLKRLYPYVPAKQAKVA